MNTLPFLFLSASIAVLHLLPMSNAVEPPATANGTFLENSLIVKLGGEVSFRPPNPMVIGVFEYFELIGVEPSRLGSNPDTYLLKISENTSIASVYQNLQDTGELILNPPLERVSLNGRLFFPVPGPPYVADRIWNFSVRAEVATGEKVAIGGLSIPGPHSKVVVIRAKGPSLVNVGIEDVLANPRIELYRDISDQIPPNVRIASPYSKILENDDWSARSIGYLELTSMLGISDELADPRESLIATLLDPGLYMTHVSSADADNDGVALLEYFILDSIEFRSAESE